MMDGMTSRKRNVDGIPTLQADLGYYTNVELDDNWQKKHIYFRSEVVGHR